MNEREKAINLYWKLRTIFDRQQHKGNVVTFPTRGRRLQSDASSLSQHQEFVEDHLQSSRPAKTRGLEGLLRQLFEELASDD